jgi:hypothetical protein
MFQRCILPPSSGPWVTHYHNNGGSTHLSNVGLLLWVPKVPHSSRLSSCANLLDLYLGDTSHCNRNGCLASLAYFPKIIVGLSNHQSVCLCVLVSIIMMMMSMWWDHVSELCPPTGLLFIPKVIDIWVWRTMALYLLSILCYALH